jgi:hypothetical protein
MQSFYNENGINIIQMDEENMNPARRQHMSPARGKGINSFTEFKVSAKMINNYFQDYLNKVSHEGEGREKMIRSLETYWNSSVYTILSDQVQLAIKIYS